MPRPNNFGNAWSDLREQYAKMLNSQQLWMKRAWLLAALAKEQGIDLEWVLRADKDAVNKGLLRYHGGKGV